MQFASELELRVEVDKSQAFWQEYLLTLAEVNPEGQVATEQVMTEGTKLFRGTSVCDILYAIIECDGEVRSPLSRGGIPYKDNNAVGTIITNEIDEAISYSRNQQEDAELFAEKLQWMSELTGLSTDQLRDIRVLWQPIVLELTSHIPYLHIQEHYAEIWTNSPINILQGALTTNAVDHLTRLTGLDIAEMQTGLFLALEDDYIDTIISSKMQLEADQYEEQYYELNHSNAKDYWDNVSEEQYNNSLDKE